MALGRTMDVVAGLADGGERMVLPREYARSITVRNRPGARARKLLMVLLGASGTGMSRGQWHALDAATIRAKDGLGNISTEGLRDGLRELMAMQVEYWIFDQQTRREDTLLGHVLRNAVVSVDPESRKNRPSVFVRWRFDEVYQELARDSNYWAVLLEEEVLRLRSGYGIELLMYLKSFEHVVPDAQVTVPLAELRRLFGLGEGKYPQYKEFNRRVLATALRAIREQAGWDVACKAVRRRRETVAVEFSWTPTDSPEDAEEVPPEPFPADGKIEGTAWAAIAAAAGDGVDVGFLGRRFAGWAPKARNPVPMQGVRCARAFRRFCRTVAGDPKAPRSLPLFNDGRGPGGGPDNVNEDILAGAPPPFPSDGMFQYDLYWREVGWKHGGGADLGVLERAFRTDAAERGFPVDAASPARTLDEFVEFCQRRRSERVKRAH